MYDSDGGTVVLLGLGASAFLVAQRPSFWIEFVVRLGKALLPSVLKYVTKRMPPEEEAAWHQAERRGRGMSGSRPGKQGSVIHQPEQCAFVGSSTCPWVSR